ncbi:hypothetical protein B0H10DRAFT_2207612 [Mycena sp. CBHHK59/15]|nr:hypothetical protein B0H10DRAFT_2207612 [Mycena sp. CBHHK59/15]
MASVLPPGPLHGHYSINAQLYTVHSGSPDMILKTPSPEEAPVIDSNVLIPLFREPRYLALKFPYLMFIPKHYAWRNDLFSSFDRIRHRPPIILDRNTGFRFRLHPDVAQDWMDLDRCLHAVGKEMFQLDPHQRWLSRSVSPWFFPARFKFLHTYRTEGAARFAVLRSIENFLPLLGYVTMGLWLMQCWEADEVGSGREAPEWRLTIAEKTKIHPAFLDYVEKAVNWTDARVGGLYIIESPEKLSSLQRKQRAEFEWILNSILRSDCPIPIYLAWGQLPAQISMFDVPAAFQEFVPDAAELQKLASPKKQMQFTPFTPPVNAAPLPRSAPTVTVAAALLPSTDESSAQAAPFPPLPANTQQKKNEGIHAFFIRRRQLNLKKMANESARDKQRRTQREQNARCGGVPKKASVFVWKKENGFYIHHLQIRGEFADLWTEYPGPERRFDPIHNQWDLCELFANNDPVFGQGFPDYPDSDDDDDDGMHPMFPPNIDLASQLPPEDSTMDIVPPENFNLELVAQEQQHPDDLEMPFEVPAEEDLGPDFAESDVPKHDLADASRKWVNSVFLKFGKAPRAQEPEYELVAESLLETLRKRFGFIMPPSPNSIVSRDPPAKYLAEQHLANVVGMPDIASQLALQPGLKKLLGLFFGQCMAARSLGGVDKILLDYQSAVFQLPHSTFEIRREELKSMRNPAEWQYYYVLRRLGSGIGSEVVLALRATDLLEALRQQWGPDVKDVITHFIARGIPFWFAYMSTQIMPASEPVIAGIRPKGFKQNTASGLGFRPYQYQFDEHDYKAYTIQRDVKLFHTPRGHIALQYGGVIARLTRAEVSDDDFFRGFDDDIYDVGDCLWDGESEHAYWYDRLSDNEIDLVCGIYYVGTGQKTVGKGKGRLAQERNAPLVQNDTDTGQAGIVSWWPKPSAWARGSLDGAWWTPQCETDFFAKRLIHFEKASVDRSLSVEAVNTTHSTAIPVPCVGVVAGDLLSAASARIDSNGFSNANILPILNSSRARRYSQDLALQYSLTRPERRSPSAGPNHSLGTKSSALTLRSCPELRKAFNCFATMNVRLIA